MLKLLKNEPVSNHEDVFLSHYEKTLKWSLQLTGNDRQQAEDLVHDVFIQFALSQPNLEEIDNLEGYLFAMLRNLMRSGLRREARGVGKAVPLEEYESAEIGLRSIDLEQHLKAREELRSICDFLCERKETSKSASALILRYFLGYFRSEIKFVTRNSESAADFLLSSARGEAKAFLNKPARLGFIKKANLRMAEVSSSSEEDSAVLIEDFLTEQRTKIFRSCQGACPTRKTLKETYKKAGTQTVATKLMAHIVSCPSCLEEVNNILNLPTLEDRFENNSGGSDDPGQTGGGSGSGSGKSGEGTKKRALNTYRKRLRETIEHEPRELLVAVNGSELGTLTVNSEENKLKLHIEEEEKMNYIEIFSEQGLRLFFVNVEPPPRGSFEKREIIELSRDRTFEIDLNFNGPGADLEVVYNYPAFRKAFKPDAQLLNEIKTELDSETYTPEENEKIDPQETASSGLFEGIPSSEGIASWFKLKFALPVGTIAALLIFALIFTQISPTTISAAELLNKSTQTEVALAADSTIALHRSVNLEQRDSNGSLIERRRLDVWQSAAKGLKIRRLYDQDNRLIVADWKRADGSRTLYRPGDAPSEIDINSGAALPKDLNDAWQLDLSAKDFSSLVGSTDSVEVEEREDTYLLSHESDKTNGLIKANLTLNKGDLRAIETRLVTREGNETREFRFSETQFEKPLLKEVPESVFEPEKELIPQVIEAPVETPEESPEASPEESPEAEESPSVEPAPLKKNEKRITSKREASTELEIEALSLLDKIGATLGSEVTVTRTANGTLRIEGVVANEKRKREVLAALRPIRKNRAVTIRIETPEEAYDRTQRSRKKDEPPKVSIQDVKPSSSTIPLDAEVRNYFKKRGVAGENVDREINKFSSQTISISRQAKLHAWSLRDYSKRFSGTKLGELKVDARKKWFSVMAGQARGYRQRLSSLRSKLSLVVGGNAGRKGAPKIRDLNSLKKAVARLTALSESIDRAVRVSFTLSSGKSAPVKGKGFWSELSESEGLARSIEEGAISLSRNK